MLSSFWSRPAPGRAYGAQGSIIQFPLLNMGLGGVHPRVGMLGVNSTPIPTVGALAAPQDVPVLRHTEVGLQPSLIAGGVEWKLLLCYSRLARGRG